MNVNIFKKKKLTADLLDPDEVLADSGSTWRGTLGHEGKMERPLERVYSVVFLFVVFIGMAYLSSRAVSLGVLSGESFLKKSQENRFMVRSVLPPRGLILDRFGKPLAINIPSYGLLFERNEFLRAGGDINLLLSRLTDILKVSPEYFFELGFPKEYDFSRLPARVVVFDGLSPDAFADIAPKLDGLPGISIFENFRRSYSDAEAHSHLVGYVSKVSPDDLLRQPELRVEETIGKTGLEAFYDGMLRGHGGRKIVEVDALGRETRFRFAEEPREGSRIHLNVDAELEKVSYETVKNFTGGRKGASVVVLDPRSGAVRGLVSFPGFNISSFSSSLSRREFETILRNPLTPFFNRAVAGEFPSGSTIKPLIAAAALEEQIIDPLKKIYDEGFIEIPNPYRPGEKSVFVDWKKHGWVDFYDAIAQSANVYFYMIGGGFKNQKGLGIERIKKYASAFGLGSQLGIDLPGEKAGFIPDPESKKTDEPGDPIWRVGDTYNVSIGQGGVRVTPLQMATLVAAIANGGKLWRPYILDSVVDRDGKEIEKREPFLIAENMVQEDNLRKVVKGMRRTVTSGTARLLSGLPMEAAAKTGTAQAGSGLPHAWVTAFAPVENPEVAIVVMVEHAGEGSTVAVPITNEILRWYFTNRK